MPEKIIRDPVHDVIAFRLEHPIDNLLFRLLNAAECQRLRRIVQLGMASLAYPGAEHSRYSHSLGVMETARKMIAQLCLSHAIDDESKIVCLTAGTGIVFGGSALFLDTAQKAIAGLILGCISILMSIVGLVSSLDEMLQEQWRNQ